MFGKQRKRILVADDDPDILKIVAANLRAEGFEVDAVSNGFEAQARAVRTLPDLIVLDVTMPGRDGLEVLTALRARPDTRDIPVVLGHMFPLWLRFHGGKGVATGAGAFLALDPIATAAGLIVFAIVIISTRFVSLASILSAASIPLFLRFLTRAPFWTINLSIVIAMAIIVKHHSNIARLAQGRERRMGERK